MSDDINTPPIGGRGNTERGVNIRRRTNHDIPDGTIILVEDEIKSLRNENKNLQDDLKTLKENVETLLSSHLGVVKLMEELRALHPASSNESRAESSAAKNKNKKRRKSKRKTKYGGIGKIGNLTKITVGSIFIALTMALGWGGMGEASFSSLLKQNGREPIRTKSNKMEDSPNGMPVDKTVKAMMPMGDEELQPRRILQESTEDTGNKLAHTASPTVSVLPTTSPRPSLSPLACTAEKPCEGNTFCYFAHGSDSVGLGKCQVCPPTKFSCHALGLENGSIADCALRCDDGFVCGNNPQVCGCSNVGQADYRGGINRMKGGHLCEQWDAEWMKEEWNINYIQTFPEGGLEENVCRNPGGDEYVGPWCSVPAKDHGSVAVGGNGIKEWDYCDIPTCDPCACEPPTCGDSKALEACLCTGFVVDLGEECCPGEDDVDECSCNHREVACRKSLRNGVTEHCDEAVKACCKDDKDCACQKWDSLCHDHPESPDICKKVPSSCCYVSQFDDDGYDYHFEDANCQCDFYNYASNVLDFEDIGSKSSVCFRAQGDIVTTKEKDRTSLDFIYQSTNGNHWYNNTGWKHSQSEEETDHCNNWFGITCNDGGFVVKLDLSNNNLTGTFGNSISKDGVLDNEETHFPLLFQLESLILAQNNISGGFRTNFFFQFRKLLHVDISHNNFNGAFDILVFPAAKQLNFSHNNFSSVVPYKRFSPSFKGLRIFDASHNPLNQDADDILLNIPPNLDELILGNCSIKGSIGNRPFPDLRSLRRLVMGNNKMNGTLPDLQRSLPRLRVLDLSKQTGNGGFTGSIPADISNLLHLTELNLAMNKLSQSIPAALGNLPNLRNLHLSNNELEGTIPTQLGKLEGVAEILDLSMNKLEGRIPSELGSLLDVSLHFSGNADISHPAPLRLCGIPGFDLRNDMGFCPDERNTLATFFKSSKGQEWTDSRGWLDEYETFCDWQGILCSDSNNTIQLKLRNNGLSGRLSESISNLSSLEVLDLSDNDIKGSIPTELGLLSNLTYLRVSYNTFTGTMPELEKLARLEFFQLHGNRISGEIKSLKSPLTEGKVSSFVADCGAPSIFEEVLICEACTMCCNSQEDCYPQEKTNIQKTEAKGFDSYLQFTLVLFLCFLALSCAIFMLSFAYGKYFLPRGSAHTARIGRDKKYAFDTIGEDSVYRFFLGNSWGGWMFALAVIASQISTLCIFVTGAEIKLDDDNSDLVYTWQCRRGIDECRDTKDLDWKGWLVFSILMAAHLLKDIINGTKMIILSGKKRHSLVTRLRFFFGGMILSSVSLFTLYVSTIYNDAIATSNTEIIVNSVVILFVTGVDELFYGILRTINLRWTERNMPRVEEGDNRSHAENNGGSSFEMLINQNLEMQNKLQSVESEMNELQKKMMEMQEQMGMKEASQAKSTSAKTPPPTTTPNISLGCPHPPGGLLFRPLHSLSAMGRDP